MSNEKKEFAEYLVNVALRIANEVKEREEREELFTPMEIEAMKAMGQLFTDNAKYATMAHSLRKLKEDIKKKES